MSLLRIHFRPADVTASALADSAVIVVDQLRASSTICQALASGATCVMPFLEVEETRLAAQQFPRSEIVLGGERRGKIIEGFDLGNSPREYAPAAVAGRRVLFTTTNGTRALYHARRAKRTLIGCALNREAVAEAVAGEPKVDILCAGTDGEVTGEDILAAGAIAADIVGPRKINRSARFAIRRWRDLYYTSPSEREDALAFARFMRDTPGGRNLLEIGHEFDLTDCAQFDALSVVPELNRTTNEIRSA